MPYTSNPNAPKVRGQAVACVQKGMGVRTTARRFGVTPGCVSKWVKKSVERGYGAIPTKSSKPKHHPKELSEDTVRAIIETRVKLRRCSDVIHQTLKNKNIITSLSSVKRTLDRNFLTKKKSPWKRWHFTIERPIAEKHGDLVEIDTIHKMIDKKKRLYIYTLIDVCTRWTFALAVDHISAESSVAFVNLAQKQAPFKFNCVQSDNGPEFSKYFTKHLKISHRNTRVRQPNDNAHIERFNRTIQEECIDKVPTRLLSIKKVLPKYLKYYNEERLHLGIDLRTPLQVINE